MINDFVSEKNKISKNFFGRNTLQRSEQVFKPQWSNLWWKILFKKTPMGEQLVTIIYQDQQRGLYNVKKKTFENQE